MPYRFGDLLALARRSWIHQMAEGVERRGYADYRATDAATLRLLRRGPVGVGGLGEVLGVTRQAARKVVAQLEQRGYVSTERDPEDGRKVNVVLTEAGKAYGAAVAEAVVELNGALEQRVPPGELAAADRVLRRILEADPGQGSRASSAVPPRAPRA